MTDRSTRQRGVTLIEMMVVIAIVSIIAGAAAVSMARGRPRASLVGTTVELRSIMHLARQRAMMSGANVAVMVFPNHVTSATSTGRIVVYQDAGFDLFLATAPVHFGTYDPAVLATGAGDEIVATFDLPTGVVFGPSVGMGAMATLPAPYANLPVSSDCTFCAGIGTARRGAVVFNSRGRASFYAADGNPATVEGGSISLTSTGIDTTGATALVRMLSVSAATGTVQSFNQG